MTLETLTFLGEWAATVIVSSGAGALVCKGWFEHKLNQRLEEHKQKLQNHTERLKHDLQREHMAAELKLNSLHQVYPEMFSKMTKAHGGVGILTGLREMIAWEKLDPDEIEIGLRNYDINDKKIEKLLASMSSDKTKGAVEIKEYISGREYSEARTLFLESKNYRLLKGLYVSQEVAKLATEFENLLWSAYVDYRMIWTHGSALGGDRERFYKEGQESEKKARELLDQIEAQMNKELSPSI